ncbi:mitochondrial inner membrane protease ATP23 homolog isoform X2 [Dysidea avara]|uniref:mitochondrial inner membrane protease ATP23 homolog isoform X2 n=1 Tax=Dysidea avara TaxID=196820 RepID=UPI00332D8FD6
MANLSDKEKEAYPAREGVAESNPRQHSKCMKKLEHAMKRSPYVKFMLQAMSKVGCPVDINKHVVCEPCGKNVSGGFDRHNNQIVLCENVMHAQALLNVVLTHELIHAYDQCRAHVDWDNIDHLACSEIRAANLSGDCFFSKENFGRLRFGWRKHQQVIFTAEEIL